MIEDSSKNKTLLKWQLFVEVAAILLLLLLWGITIWAFYELPESIPVHFDLSGTVDRYGHKSSLFLLASIATVIYIGLSLLSRFGKRFNFPNNGNGHNSAAQLAFVRKTFLLLKLLVLFIFLFITVFTCLIALNKLESMGVWTYILLGIIFLPTILIIAGAFKAKQKIK